MSRSTLTGVDDASRPSAVWARRAALAAMTLFVVAGLAGVLGVHTGQVSAEGGGYALTVRYPQVARAGLDVRWQVRVTHRGGFGSELTLAVTGDYFDIFETQGFHPDPASTTRDGETLLLTFVAPPGETFLLDYDAYTQPSSQQGRAAHVSLLIDGRPVAAVDFSTHLVP